MDWMEFFLSFPGFVAVMLVVCVFVVVITEMIRWAIKMGDKEPSMEYDQFLCERNGRVRIDKSWDSIEKTNRDIKKEGL